MVRPEEARIPQEPTQKPQQERPEREGGRDFDRLNNATARVREEVEHLVEGFDINAIGRKIEDFGREKPFMLALGALALGAAAGYLIRSTSHSES